LPIVVASTGPATTTRPERSAVAWHNRLFWAPQADGQPVRLAGWASAVVPAGETATVIVECDERMWRTWDTVSGSWQVLTGGELLVARGLGDIRQRLPQ